MSPQKASRREFLEGMGLGTLGLAGAGATLLPETNQAAQLSPAVLTRLTEHLWVYRGPINVGILRDGNRALLIDCGDGSVAGRVKDCGVRSIDRVLFTHHHRDQACGAHLLAEAGARIVVPQAERGFFEKVAEYWNNPQTRWHIYNFHPHHLMLAEPVRVDGSCVPGQALGWGSAKIQALATPGHTDGSMSFVVDSDGQRVLFCGDAIYDQGQVWEIYSLQKGTQTSDYHGFLGARPQLQESLGRIKAARPQLLVPSHGRIMTNPAQAIDSLVARLDLCYDRYVAISALRHYFPKMFTAYAGRKDHMPIRPGKTVPACLRHVGTTWVLISRDKAAFVMDCGSPEVVRTLQDWLRRGDIRSVEGLWVTHYHDDHVDAIPEFQKAFACPCFTDNSVAEVIGDPLAFRLPCISPSRARVDQALGDGQSWKWHEYRLTAYHFPGQTLHHAGLLVEGEGLRLLFVGDSFTMSGIDDYCAWNRTWLGPGVGFDRCLALIEKIQPTHIFNCHVNEAFDFTPQECRFMRANLAQREKLFGELVPWDHANYGMDESWVHCHPYEQRVARDGKAKIGVVITNHSSAPRTASCRLVPPRGWFKDSSPGSAPGMEWQTVEVLPKTASLLKLPLPIPKHVRAGRYVVPVDLRYGSRSLPQFTEAILTIA